MSANAHLRELLERVASRRRQCGLWGKLTGCWAVTAVAASLVFELERQTGWAFSLAVPGLTLLAFVAAFVLVFRHRRTKPDLDQLARGIESRHHELDGRLLTAVQSDASNDELNYLQQRVVEEALLFSHKNDWASLVPKSRMNLVRCAHWLALIILAFVIWNGPSTERRGLLTRISDFSVTVNPGDVSLERGSSLVVLARFHGIVPASAEMVMSQQAERKSGGLLESSPGLQRIPLVKSLADPVFGGSVRELATNILYHIEYAGQRTRDFKVDLFEYPRLERTDLELTFPEYTAQPPKRIENTRRLSAVEGSLVDLKLQLNKPVVSARLVGKDKEHTILPLDVETNRAMAALRQFQLGSSRTYELQLVDADGRTNKAQAQFVFDALKNRAPEVRITSPRGDLRPSALEEIPFEGTVWDDFGVRSYGLAYTVPGRETKFVQLGGEVPANEKRPFKYVLRLEDLEVQPDQLLAWFMWAEDIGPDGKVRRTSGDLFFAEVRAFDEIFREGQGQEAGGQPGGPQENQSGRLIDLQKKIISATWNLQRQHGNNHSPEGKSPTLRTQEPNRLAVPSNPVPKQSRLANPSSLTFARLAPDKNFTPFFAQPRLTGPLVFGQLAPPLDRRNGSPANNNSLSDNGKSTNYYGDALVVRDSQAQALDQAESTSSQQRDPRAQSLWNAAIKEMENALARLDKATNSPMPLPDALAAEQAAYQALLKLQEHEYQVVRNRNSRSQGGGGMSERMQKQLEQMEMTQSENRYEKQNLAQPPRNNQAREQLQVMDRLQELARRQQDLNDRLKELQTALQEARTEQEREEIRLRLKRLQEEEQQMLADVDELRQRMDKPENQSRMADERRQLDQTREDIQRAAEASNQGAASQALAAGTRAQRQLQQLRDQVRKENSSQFSDDMRQMRSDARELARQQEEIQKRVAPDTGDSRIPKTLSDAPKRDELIKGLEQQKARMTNLVDRATQLSEQAENAEPLLARQLYDTVRKFSQDNLKDLKETEEELVSRRLMTESLLEQLKQSQAPDGVKLLDAASEMLHQDFRQQAFDTIKRTRGSIEDFKRGVERAADSVLGDDTEALRLAQQELDQLTEQLQREIAQAENKGASTNQEQASARSAGGKETLDRRWFSRNEQGQKPDSAQPNSQASNQPSGQSEPSDQQTSGQKSDSQGNGQQSARTGQNRSPNGEPTATGQEGGQQRNGDRDQAGARVAQGSRAGSAFNGGANDGGGGGDWFRNFDRLLNDNTTWRGGPLTGGDFGPWSERLRDIEEVLEFPALRNEVAAVRERARLMRQDFKRDQKKPDWAVVRLQVMKPLLEVRDSITDELARRQSTDALVPIDRDPVPNHYSSLVQHYYEELGKDKGSPPRR